METVDINCDMGESPDASIDAALMPLVTSCNVACGLHAGSVETMAATMQLARAHNVAVGAHPSYPDREGFGRRRIEIGSDELVVCLADQIDLAVSVVTRMGGRLAHVKPHGALYNVAANCEQTTRCIIDALQRTAPHAALMGLAGSVTQAVAEELEHPFIPEAFADRRYALDGTLLPRTTSDAVIHAPEIAASQALSIVQRAAVDVEGTSVEIHAETICVHGDNPAALKILTAIDAMLAENGIKKTCR